MVASKQYNTQSRISLEILKRCSSIFPSGLYITKEAKWHLSCHCHDNSYATDSVLIKTKIPRFYPKQYGNHLSPELDPLSHFKRLQIGLFGFSQKKDWSRDCCHGNNIVGVIHMKVFALRLVLKQRHKRTRQWRLAPATARTQTTQPGIQCSNHKGHTGYM